MAGDKKDILQWKTTFWDIGVLFLKWWKITYINNMKWNEQLSAN